MARYYLRCTYEPPGKRQTPLLPTWTIEAATDWAAIRTARARSGHLDDASLVSAVILNAEGRIVWTDRPRSRPLHALGLEAPPPPAGGTAT